MFNQGVVNIPVKLAEDSEEKRREFGKVLIKHAAEVVEIVAPLPPAEQQAVLEMAKQIVIANNARLYDQSMKNMEGQVQNAFGQMLGITNPNDALPIRPLSKNGVSWLQEELSRDEPEEVKP